MGAGSKDGAALSAHTHWLTSPALPALTSAGMWHLLHLHKVRLGSSSHAETETVRYHSLESSEGFPGGNCPLWNCQAFSIVPVETPR